ncbi:MAG: hypothetical protein EAZ53_05335 [Bacteroidetes bacterium]|nr:MAG: hypothetical protein EAZ53_05335 [Bacteroidota bacterium]
MKNYIAILATVFVLCNCSKEVKPKAVLTLFSENTGDGTTDLHIHGSEKHKFVTLKGDTFTVDNFKYYISNVKLSNETSSYSIPDSYYLFGYEDGDNLRESGASITGIPDGEYTKISFSIGVDGAANASTAKKGDLDPNNNMAWNWDTGYKFVTLEGNFLNGTVGGITYHIGKNENYKELSFDLPSKLIIQDGATPKITLLANARMIFSGVSDLRLGATSVVMGGPNAIIAANNYAAGMMKVSKVVN